MERIILSAVGAAAAVFGAVMLIKTLIFRLNAEECAGEVVSSRQNDKGRYVHTLKYTVNGKQLSCEDTAGYSRPFDAGEIKTIIYDKRSPESFRFADENKMNIVIFGALTVVGIVFFLRFVLT